MQRRSFGAEPFRLAARPGRDYQPQPQSLHTSPVQTLPHCWQHDLAQQPRHANSERSMSRSGRRQHGAHELQHEPQPESQQLEASQQLGSQQLAASQQVGSAAAQQVGSQLAASQQVGSQQVGSQQLVSQHEPQPPQPR